MAMIELYVNDHLMRLMADNIAASYSRTVSDLDHVMSQVMVVGEESGEYLGAYRRMIGRARRSGTREEMLDELADVIISACHSGWLLGVNDFQEVLDRKLVKIHTRGWKE